MKKIIHQGRDTYHATCGECGCAFTYQREDVHHNYVYGGDRVSCPHCGHSLHHFGASGTRWGDDKPRRSMCAFPQGGYEPSGPLPRGSCFRGQA